MIRPALLALLVAASPAMAGEYDAQLSALAHDRLKAIAQDPAIVQAIAARNAEGAPSAEEIDRLDKEWRAQVGAASAPMIAALLDSPASRLLDKARDESQGVISEAFVMDAAGLNVALSDPTSDYWQGDEAKWQQTFAVGPEALHLSDVEFDESTQTYQAQVSMPVVDPASGKPIGAITFGVNVEYLD